MRTRIDWQYLLGLGLDDPGFDHTVLTEFRAGWQRPAWSRPHSTGCWRA